MKVGNWHLKRQILRLNQPYNDDVVYVKSLAIHVENVLESRISFM